MNSEWGKVSLGDVADIIMGQSPPGDTVSDEKGLALLNGPTEFGGHHPSPVQFTTDARKRALPGDILFCVRGSTGRMNWADQDYAIGRGIAAIRHREEPELQPFVRAVIETELPELLSQATGSTFTNVSASQIAAIPYPNLAKEEQRAIAHILGTLDDKIELNRRLNQTLEAMARAIFQDWFVDFGPVRAKLAGQEPYLPTELWALFPDRLAATELGEAPEGWGVKALGELCSFRAGSVFPRASQGEGFGTYPFIKVSDMNRPGNSFAILESANWVEYEDLSRLKAKPFPRNTTVFAKIGEALKQNRFRLIVKPTIIDNNMMGAIPDTNVIEPLIFFDALSRFDLGELAGGTAVPYLTVSELSSLTIPVPPRSEQEILAQTVRPIYDKLIANETESRHLSAQRDALLPKLVSGEVRVGSNRV